MTSAIDRSSMSVPARVWRFLRGPRFIDLPIRLLALIMGLTILVPGSFEIAEPRYAAFLILAYGLIVLAAFLPLTIVIATTGLGMVFSQLYPSLENMYPEALILATAVLISRRRWIGFALGTVGLAAYLIVATRLGAYDAGFEGLTDLGYGWLTYALLGLSASFVEVRIRREIGRRERAAVEHQKTLDAMRARFTSDMHDTISHSLTTESAIIRTLAKETDSENAARLLAELSLVNAEATKRLRQLVTSLSTWEAESCTGDRRSSRIRFRTEAEQLTTAIEDGCTAGSVPLTTSLSPLPAYSSSTLGHHFRAVMLELATNVIRHSTPATPASIEVEIRGEHGDRAELICRSTNETPAELTQVPRSLARRATAVGGACRVETDEEKRAVVEVALPVRFLSPSAGAPSARPSAGSPSAGSPSATAVANRGAAGTDADMIDVIGDDVLSASWDGGGSPASTTIGDGSESASDGGGSKSSSTDGGSASSATAEGEPITSATGEGDRESRAPEPDRAPAASGESRANETARSGGPNSPGGDRPSRDDSAGRRNKVDA
ncbi:histidine kinase [Brevibacterium oceani]|uniref:histidine kinase n=1 Tax=Brevibacterium oceani TaxID=358099 RepID=UPI001B3282B0|nr:histidine kinase [Brevibacterium oceani]